MPPRTPQLTRAETLEDFCQLVLSSVDLADAIVAGIGDVDVASSIDRHSPRVVELGEGTIGAAAGGAGEGGDEVAEAFDGGFTVTVVTVDDRAG